MFQIVNSYRNFLKLLSWSSPVHYCIRSASAAHIQRFIQTSVDFQRFIQTVFSRSSGEYGLRTDICIYVVSYDWPTFFTRASGPRALAVCAPPSKSEEKQSLFGFRGERIGVNDFVTVNKKWSSIVIICSGLYESMKSDEYYHCIVPGGLSRNIRFHA